MKIIANYLFFNEYIVLCLHLFASANISALNTCVCSQEQGNDNGECISAKVNLCNGALTQRCSQYVGGMMELKHLSTKSSRNSRQHILFNAPIDFNV
jgi:hypothetical protein